jgi:hypothetical protein
MQIEILDPCDNPFSLTQPVQPIVPDYYYSADQPLLTFDTAPFTVDPSVCLVTYSCATTVTPAGVDICDLVDGATEASFNIADGSYFLNTIDMVKYPPGTYTLQLTGTSGLKSESFTVDLVLVDPCLTIDLNL